MRLLNQFLRFELSAVFATPEFTNAITKIVNKCIREQNKLKGGTIVNGLLLDTDKMYVKPEWSGINLLIFANSVNRYLLPLEYLVLEDGGFQLLVGDQPTVEDNFVIFFTTDDILATYSPGILFTTEGDVLYTTEDQQLLSTQTTQTVAIPTAPTAGKLITSTDGDTLFTTEGNPIITN